MHGLNEIVAMNLHPEKVSQGLNMSINKKKAKYHFVTDGELPQEEEANEKEESAQRVGCIDKNDSKGANVDMSM
jgi:hypothetical protein